MGERFWVRMLRCGHRGLGLDMVWLGVRIFQRIVKSLKLPARPERERKACSCGKSLDGKGPLQPPPSRGRETIRKQG